MEKPISETKTHLHLLDGGQLLFHGLNRHRRSRDRSEKPNVGLVQKRTNVLILDKLQQSRVSTRHHFLHELLARVIHHLSDDRTPFPHFSDQPNITIVRRTSDMTDSRREGRETYESYES